jgi:hypothetical protein
MTKPIEETLKVIWEAEKESHRLRVSSDILKIIKEVIDYYNIVSTDPERPPITDTQLYLEIEHRILNSGK